MRDAIPVGRIAGFPVSMHWSVPVILWLFAWSLATSLPQAVPGYSTATYWIAGALGAAVLLASLLAHELAHAVVARREGIPVKGVTLWLFGGVTRLGAEAKTPKSEFRVAVSGPATSLLLAVLFAGLAVGLRALGVTHVVVAVAWWLSGINLLLGLFNLLPGAPLDGGQVLRAYLWHRYRDRTRAAVGASRGGRVVAFLLIALGLLEFVAGSVVSGVWLAFIGWFLFVAAREEEAQASTRRSLEGVRVADVMTAHPDTAPGWITVEEFIQRFLLGDRHSAYPVQARDGSIVGLITLAQLRAIPPSDRATTLVGDAAIPPDQVTTAAPQEPVSALLERMAPNAAGKRALVVDAGRVVGVVTATDITRAIEVRELAVREPVDGRGS